MIQPDSILRSKFENAVEQLVHDVTFAMHPHSFYNFVDSIKDSFLKDVSERHEIQDPELPQAIHSQRVRKVFYKVRNQVQQDLNVNYVFLQQLIMDDFNDTDIPAMIDSMEAIYLNKSILRTIGEQWDEREFVISNNQQNDSQLIHQVVHEMIAEELQEIHDDQ